MAKSKAELLADHDEYSRRSASARAAEQHGQFLVALDEAESSWLYVDGAMQFARKYLKDPMQRVESTDIVLRASPLVFGLDRLDRLQAFLQDQKRIVRGLSEDFDSRLEEARRLTWKAWELWTWIDEHKSATEQDAVGALHLKADEWKTVSQAWTKLDLVRLESANGRTAIAPTTRLESVWRAKCPGCGAVAKAPKVKFLEAQICPKCTASVWFVLLSSVEAG